MSTPDHTPEADDAMTSEEKRHDQLTSAPEATEADAAPRIEVSEHDGNCLLYTSPSPRDLSTSRMPSSA